MAADTPKGKAAERFKQLAEERTGGKVRVEIYPNSQLYKDKEEVEALQLGAVQMLAPTSSKFGPLGVPEFEVFDLPFMFPSRDALHRVTEGPIGAEILKRLEPHGIIGLAYWDNGFKNISANKPLLKPEDVRGLKMRIHVPRAARPDAGAEGEPAGDGHGGGLSGLADRRRRWDRERLVQHVYAEVPRGSEARHADQPRLYRLRRDREQTFLGRTAPDIRAVLEQAMRETTTFANQIAQKENDDAMAAIRASGLTEVHDLTAAERAAWRKVLQPVQDEMETRVGKELVTAIRRETDAAP